MTTVGYVLFFIIFVILAVVAVGIVVFDVRLNQRIDRVNRAEEETGTAPVETNSDDVVFRVQNGRVTAYVTAQEKSTLAEELKQSIG